MLELLDFERVCSRRNAGPTHFNALQTHSQTVATLCVHEFAVYVPILLTFAIATRFPIFE